MGFNSGFKGLIISNESAHCNPRQQDAPQFVTSLVCHPRCTEGGIVVFIESDPSVKTKMSGAIFRNNRQMSLCIGYRTHCGERRK